jgi:pimeloyl-ACP methyl ester carboxylesterase
MQLAAPASSVPGVYWQWQGHRVYYVRAGKRQEQRPPLLLIHGFGASTDHWRKNIAQLQEDFEVWAIDLLGFGRSGKPELAYSGELWREQIKDFIEQVIGVPVVLAGNSLGGYASLCVAAAYPELSRGLVLINSAGPFSEGKVPSPPNFWQSLVRSLLLQPWASYLLFQYVRQKSNIRKTLEKVYLDKSAVTEQLVEDIYRPSCDAGAAQVFAAVFKNPQGESVDRLLEQLKSPLLLIWGEADPWMNSRERGAKFRQYYPNLQEHYLQAGHCPHDEIPEQFNQLLATWVQSL